MSRHCVVRRRRPFDCERCRLLHFDESGCQTDRKSLQTIYRPTENDRSCCTRRTPFFSSGSYCPSTWVRNGHNFNKKPTLTLSNRKPAYPMIDHVVADWSVAWPISQDQSVTCAASERSASSYARFNVVAKQDHTVQRYLIRFLDKALPDALIPALHGVLVAYRLIELAVGKFAQPRQYPQRRQILYQQIVLSLQTTVKIRAIEDRSGRATEILTH